MRKLLALGAACAIVATSASLFELRPQDVGASSHREAPAISQDPSADNTDTYIFRSPDAPGTITLVANYYPYEGPAGGPNFYRFSDDVLYEFHVDNDGDARDDITYQFRFDTTILNQDTFLYNTGQLTTIDDSDRSLKQTYKVRRIEHGHDTLVVSDLLTPPSNVGTHSIPSYAPLRNAAIQTIDSDVKVFAGQRADPFFADVGAIFDLLTIRGGIPAGFSSGGRDTFRYQNVQTIALQIPIAKLTDCHCVPAAGDFDNDIVGFWASASRRPHAISAGEKDKDGDAFHGPWVQVSRLGSPLVNEAVIPMSLKDKFNRSKPIDDVKNFAGPVLDPELAQLLAALYGVPVPPAPRNDLIPAFLTGFGGLNQPNGVVPAEMLRLNVTTPLCGGANPACSRFGVIAGDPQGFPNGRRLTDDVIDIAERVVAGVASGDACCTGFPNNALGDGVNAPFTSLMGTFPYVADPYDGFNYPP